MILVVNGPLGIGKSTTAWGLIAQFESAVLLDMDYIAAFHPFDFYNPAHLEYCMDTLAVLVRHHRAHGYEHFVVNWVFESRELLARIATVGEEVELPVQSFLLTCDPDVLEQRIRRRNLPNVEWEVQRGRELLGILERDPLGMTPIDTTHLTADAVVAHIWQAIDPAKGDAS